MTEHNVKICQGTGCLSSGSAKITDQLGEVANSGTSIEITGCHGFCSQGPLMVVDEYLYVKVSEANVKLIASRHLEDNSLHKGLFYREPTTKARIAEYQNIPFYKRQQRLLLARCGLINPENIMDYLNHDGYQGLQKALCMSPEEVISEITLSNLRGRGGAGFPTGLKWRLTKEAVGSDKYIIINADEGDPGAFMDRSILEADPHSVIEGAIIGGYAMGANQGFIYIRAEYPLAVRRFQLALDQARNHGYLGNNILGSDFSFDIAIYDGAGAFVCGEETALIASMQGTRGIPVQKPPFPSTSGLWSSPTTINNVKTWAAASWILANGSDAFKSIGTDNSAGTAIFSLTGKINNSGLVEVAMGTTLREIIFEIGGGIPNDRKFKAVQTGGPSGGVIPQQFLDTPVDFRSLAEIGSIMGSGGMVVVDELTCMVDLAKYFLSFTQSESCGKCTPCREGTLRALEILERITTGKGRLEDLEALQKLSHVITDTSLCGLGQTAPNPILSSMIYFYEEYREHVNDKMCRAGSCVGMFSLEIDHDLCNNCSKCQRGCSFDAVLGDRQTGFKILTNTCEGCSACLQACPKNAIEIKPPH